MSINDLKEVWEIERYSFGTPWPIAQFYLELRNSISQTYTAKIESSGRLILIGYVIFWLVAQEAHFLNIAVHSLYRHQGIGSKLLTYALGLCKEAGAKDAFLEVRRSNIPAQRLYKKFGFREVGVRKGYYSDNGEDAILMTLKI